MQEELEGFASLHPAASFGGKSLPPSMSVSLEMFAGFWRGAGPRIRKNTRDEQGALPPQL